MGATLKATGVSISGSCGFRKEFGFSVKNGPNSRSRNLCRETKTKFAMNFGLLCGIYSVKPKLAGFQWKWDKYLCLRSEHCNGRC